MVDTVGFPFEETMPAAPPRVADAVEGIFDWIEATSLSRVHFYSAREDTSKTHYTKESFQEQLTNLAAQVQMIGEEQQKLLSKAVSPGGAQSSADPVGVPLAEGALMSRLPNVSNGLGFLMSAPKRAATLLGPPPKTKAVPPSLDSCCTVGRGRAQGHCRGRSEERRLHPGSVGHPI